MTRRGRPAPFIESCTRDGTRATLREDADGQEGVKRWKVEWASDHWSKPLQVTVDTTCSMVGSTAKSIRARASPCSTRAASARGPTGSAPDGDGKENNLYVPKLQEGGRYQKDDGDATRQDEVVDRPMGLTLAVEGPHLVLRWKSNAKLWLVEWSRVGWASPLEVHTEDKRALVRFESKVGDDMKARVATIIDGQPGAWSDYVTLKTGRDADAGGDAARGADEL